MNLRASKLDLSLLRWTLTGAALALGGCAFLGGNDTWIVPYACIVFGLAMTAYYGHILIWRLQCSLLDLIVSTAFLGNAVGMLLVTLGAVGAAWAAWATLPLLTGWTAMGAVHGIIYARLIGTTSPLVRASLLLFAWLQYLAPPFLIIGCTLEILGRNSVMEKSLGRQVMSYSLPLLIAGAVLLVVVVFAHWKLSRKARQIVKAAQPQAVEEPSLSSPLAAEAATS